MIDRIAGQGDSWQLLEHFKSAYGVSARSSNESWAESDLQRAMQHAADNAPLFIEAFVNACAGLQQRDETWYVPEASFINALLVKHQIGYEIRPPDLLLREWGSAAIPVAVEAPSVTETAKETIERSLDRSEELLREGRPREAVQEVLWLLETVATAFRGKESSSGRIEGKYFNQIVRHLKSQSADTTLERVLDWITAMHGYLSSPQGGGVRHGMDLADGVPLNLNEAPLFCNLTRSYIHFLLVEHQNLK